MAHAAPKWRGGPGCLRACRCCPTGDRYSARCLRGRMRGAAYSVVPQHARWQVLCSVSRKRAAMFGMTCGRSVVMVAAFRHDVCFRNDATGAGRQRRFGFISVPPPLYAGHVESVPIGGVLRQGGHCGTQGRCPRVPGGQSRVT